MPPTTPPKRRWIRYLFVLVGLFALTLLSVGWYFSSLLMYTGPPRCNEKTFFFCKTPKERGLAFEEIRFKSLDGTNLGGWWVPAQGSSRVIIFSHGRGADRRVALRLMPALHKAGFHVFSFDYRHCGTSDRSFNTMGGYERQDLQAAIDYVEKVKKIHRIGLYGLSLGAAIGIQVMARDQRIAAGIFEGGFSDVIGVTAERAKSLYGVPRWPLLSVAFWLYSLRTGVDYSKIHPKDYIAKIAPRPVFLIHGEADHVVPTHHGKVLFKRAKEPKELWIATGKGHTSTWQRHPKEMERRALAFYQKYLALEASAIKKPPTPARLAPASTR